MRVQLPTIHRVTLAFTQIRKRVRCALRTNWMHELDFRKGACRFCGRDWSELYPPSPSHKERTIPTHSPTGDHLNSSDRVPQWPPDEMGADLHAFVDESHPSPEPLRAPMGEQTRAAIAAARSIMSGWVAQAVALWAALPVRKGTPRGSRLRMEMFGAAVVGAAVGVGLFQLVVNTRAPARGLEPSVISPSASAQSPAGLSPGAAVPGLAPARVIASVPAGMAVARRPIELAPRKLVSEGQITVRSTPPGARVTVDGIGWGDTPLTVRHLTLGSKTVRLTRAGYRSQQRRVDLRDDRLAATLGVTLLRLQQ